MNLFKSKKSHSKQNRGFTLVELIVSVSIFVMITTIILANHSQFSGTLLIENLAYDIALSIRKAQVFGLSIRESSAGFEAGYGIHFDTNSNNSYIFFSDTNENKIYDGSSEAIETFTIGKGTIISQFCVTSSIYVRCSPTDITSLDIVFDRPNPDAIITTSLGVATYESAEITILAPNGTQWKVETIVTGQISVHK